MSNNHTANFNLNSSWGIGYNLWWNQDEGNGS